MKKRVLSLMLIALISGSVFGQISSLNMTQTGYLPYGDDLNDVWGYSAAGREYALVGVQTGVSIVDITDPANPVQLQFMPGPTSVWRDLKTHGHYAYVSNEENDGLRIIDLSTLPGQVVYKDTVMEGINTIHNLWITNGILYVLGPGPGVFNGGMVMYDLNANPWVPTFLGAYTDRYVHDVYVRNNIAYCAEINDGLLTIVDVSNPANPQVMGSRSYVNSFTHNTWLNGAGDVVFTTDELSEAYIYAWDISDPTDIRELDRIRSELSPNGTAIPHNAHVLDDYIIVSYYRDGIYVIDASRPHNLVEVGHYDTSPLLEGDGFNGSWGAYPFLPSGVVLASDMEEGLFVLTPNYVRGCYLEGTITDASSNQVLSGVRITIAGTDLEDMSRTNGSYAVGTAVSGSYTVEYARFGYQTETRTVNLSNGVLTIEDVALQPNESVSMNIQVLESGSNSPIPNAIVQMVAPAQAFTYDFMANATGEVSSPIFTGSYELIAGKWGYITSAQNVVIDPANTNLIIYLDRGYYDDFTFDFGWTEVGNAETGAWERAEPVGTETFNGNLINPDFDIVGDISDKAFITGNGGGNIGSDDVDNGTTTIISPSMDLNGYNEPIISYHWWLVNFSFGGGGGAGDDFLRIQLSDGSMNQDIALYTDDFSNEWTFEPAIRVLDYFPPNSVLRVIVSTQDEGDQNIVEAGFDGFQLIDAAPNTDAIDQALTHQQFNIGPNPVENQLNLNYQLPVRYADGALNFSLQTLQGAEIATYPLKYADGETSIDFPFAHGVYLGILMYNNSPVSVRKIVK